MLNLPMRDYGSRKQLCYLCGLFQSPSLIKFTFKLKPLT